MRIESRLLPLALVTISVFASTESYQLADDPFSSLPETP